MPTSDEQNRRPLIRPHVLIDYADSLPGPQVRLDRELANQWKSAIEDLLQRHTDAVEQKGREEERASTAWRESVLVDCAYEFAVQDPEGAQEIGQLEKIKLQAKHFLVPEPVTIVLLIGAAIKILQTRAEFTYKDGKWTIKVASGSLSDATVRCLLQALEKALGSAFSQPAQQSPYRCVDVFAAGAFPAALPLPGLTRPADGSRVPP